MYANMSTFIERLKTTLDCHKPKLLIERIGLKSLILPILPLSGISLVKFSSLTECSSFSTNKLKNLEIEMS